MTILFQPPNRIGLGHLSRLIAIALAVKDARPDVRVPFVVGGTEHGLLESQQLPYLCLPDWRAIHKLGGWEAWNLEERRRVVFALASTMIEALRPALIVFDCFPHGAIAQAAVKQSVPVAICLRAMKEMEPHYAEIRKYGRLVRTIIVPHTEEECPVPADLRSRTCFTGPITRPLPARSAAHERSDARPDRSKFVVIAGGGGGYPGTVDFYNLALAALSRAMRTVTEVEGLLVTGPLFQDWWQLRPVDGVRVMPFDPQHAATLARADLVVCQAGYNTIAELRALGVPAICMPSDRLADDQFKRASEAESSRLRSYTGCDPEVLARLMVDALTRRTPVAPVASPAAPPAPPAAGGRRIAAEALLRLLETPSA